MKKISLILVLVFALYRIAPTAWADAAPKANALPRPDIGRGYNAVEDAFKHHPQQSILKTSVVIAEPVKAVEQTGKATPEFMLGANFNEWDIITAKLKKPDHAYDNPEALDLAEKAADHAYLEFRRLQKETGVDDAAFFESIGHKTFADSVAGLAAWDKKMQAQAEAARAASEQKADADRIAKETAEKNAQVAKEKAAADQERIRRQVFLAKLPQLVKESQARAVQKHPDLAKSGSPLNGKFVAAYHKLQADNDPRLQTADWPERLADECAAQP